MVGVLLLYDRGCSRGRLGLRLGRDRPLRQGHGFGPVGRLRFGPERSGVGRCALRRPAEDRGRPSGRRRGCARRAVDANRAEPIPLRRDRQGRRHRLRPLLGHDRGEVLPHRPRIGRGRLRLRQRRQARPLFRHRHAPACLRHSPRQGPESDLFTRTCGEEHNFKDVTEAAGWATGLLPRDRRRRHRQRRRSRRLPLQLRRERPFPEQWRRDVPGHQQVGRDRTTQLVLGRGVPRLRQRRRPRPLRRQLRHLEASRG